MDLYNYTFKQEANEEQVRVPLLSTTQVLPNLR